MKIVRLAWHNLWRDKNASEVQILLFSLLIAIAASIAIACFSWRLNLAMHLRANEFLAADLVLESSSKISNEQAQIICNLTQDYEHQSQQQSLEYAQLVEFASVISSDNAMLLISAKAVSSSYPLRGELKSALKSDAIPLIGGMPALNEVWVDSRILAALDLELGSTITLGNKQLQVTRILLSEPDNANDFYSFNPHLIFNLEDLDATGVIAPGSRVKYRHLLAGSANLLQEFKAKIAPTLNANQKILDTKQSNNQISRSLQRAEQYLSLATLIAIILAALAVALAAMRFAAKRFNSSALLRCLGLTQKQIICFFSLQLLFIGLIASVIGSFVGYCSQLGLFYLLRNFLPPNVPNVGFSPFLSGIGTGLVALIGFSLPSIVALGRVPPLRVLRSDAAPHKLSTWLSYLLAIVSLVLIMWHLALNTTLILALVIGGLGACLILGIPLFLALRKLRQISQNAALIWRMSLGQLLRYPFLTCGQILAFGLILTCMALIGLLRTELLDDWQKQLPANAPNHFALNIMPHELDAFKSEVKKHSAKQSPFYPITMGRITAINDQKVSKQEQQQDSSLRRDLSLTFSADLPNDNLITQGTWWQKDDTPKMVQISLEQEFAKRLKVGIGDKLTLQIAGQNITAQILSLRKVNWENFEPNFFVIFNPNSLHNCVDNTNCVPIKQTLALTYLVSFYFAPNNDANLLALSRNFPTVSILPLTNLIAQLRTILAQVTLAVEAILLFVLAASIMVLLAGLQTSLDERLKSGALLRALGAPRLLLQRVRLCEFALLGGLSGVLAVICAEIVSFALYHFIFNLSWNLHLELLFLPIIGSILIGAIGVFGSRKIGQISPLQVLREC